MRLVVVGAGVIGLLTALKCVGAGWDVTLVDRGPVPNPDSASHDRNRILRALHPGDDAATLAAAPAHDRWRALEISLGAEFYRPIGALTAVPEAAARQSLAALAEAELPARVADTAELNVRLATGTVGILEENGGVLLADRVLTSVAAWLRAHIRIVAYRSAVRIDPHQVTFDDGSTLVADRILLAIGAWSSRLLPGYRARCRIHRQTVLYCSVPEPSAWAGTPAIPAIGDGAWLIPPTGDAPLKLSAHSACRTVPDVTSHVAPPETIADLVSRFTALIPAFHAGWVTGARDCYYAADAHSGGPVVTELAEGSVIAHIACGGGSFKLAPLIAENLADQLAGRNTSDRLQRQEVPRC